MKFIDICKMTQKELKAALVSVLKTFGYKPVVKDGFIYAEGTVPVLLAAHMDTVHKERCSIICSSQNGDCIMSPQGIGGDDRCGIFMILETIKELRCSVIFTEDEEVGCVGAGKFCKSGIKPGVPLNYIIEFDRKNANDAVFYDCDNPEFEEFVTDKAIGFKTAWGSCSDISDIAPHLGIAAVNLSCGYYNQHTQHEYVIMSEMLKNIERGKQLIRKPCEKPFEYIEKVYTRYKYGNYGSYYGYGYGSYGYGSYGSKKTGYTSGLEDYDDSDLYYEGLYDHIDTTAIEYFEYSFGYKVKKERLVPVVELCDYKSGKLVVVTEDGEKEISEYCSPGVLYMSKDSCGLYVIDDENTYGIEVACTTNDYIKMKDGSSVMYYPDTMIEFPVMEPEMLADFVDYVDECLEYDISYGGAGSLGTLI